MLSRESNNYVQNIIGIKKIVGGLIFLDSGKVIGLLEILPINFIQRSTEGQNNIIAVYHGLFKICPSLLHFKTFTEKVDVNKLISNIRKANEKEKNPEVLAQVEDYIANIKRITKEDTIRRRFFLSYEYEGNSEGKKSNDINEIYRDMENVRISLTNVLNSIGHIVVSPSFDDKDFETCDILYRLFNPKTSNEETLNYRYQRLMNDQEKFKDLTGSNIVFSESDLIAPRGIDSRNSKYIISDGMYITYLVIRDNGYPTNNYVGWVFNLDGKYSAYTDIDIIAKKLNSDTVLPVLEQYNRWNRVSAVSNENKVDKANEILNKVANIQYITEGIKNQDEDLWDVMTIITIKAKSLAELYMVQEGLNKDLQASGYYLDKCNFDTFEYYKMTMPYTYINQKIWTKNKRNMLSYGLACMYNYMSYELFDDTGFALGRNIANNTIVSLDNFNTSRYSNANICIIGTSGSGKTFTEQMLAYRMRMTDVRCFFILPVKGYEYEEGCRNMGGEYIKLYPGAETCINIMQIRPRAEGVEEQKNTNSLLVEKVVSITTFLQLLMGKEEMTINEKNILNNAIVRVYERFGITKENDSIYADKKNKIIKQMPILKNLAVELKREPELSRIFNVLSVFVEGSCSNMNGDTNVNLRNKYIVFDVDEDVISEDYLPAFLYIAFDCAYSISKQNKLSKKAIFMDEVWKMLSNEDCAKQVKKMVKLVRGYGASTIIATQDIEDFLDCQNGYGRSVLNSTEIRIMLSLKDEEIKAVSNCINLTSEDKLRIAQLKRGYGLVYSNGDKVFTEFKASNKEIELFTTDINIKQRLAKKRRNKNEEDFDDS